MNKHCAELLLDLKLHGAPDPLRKKRPFSEDISSAHGVLFNPRYTKLRKVKAYRKWIESGQPCVFGRVAAKNENIFICPLDESEILRMRHGDADLKDTIQDYRQVWKRYALEGLSSSFLILLIAPSVVTCAPGPELKELCRRLMELYMELPRIEDDSYHVQREYLFLRGASGDATKIIKFSTLPNVFCAQGDGRWWHVARARKIVGTLRLKAFVIVPDSGKRLVTKTKAGNRSNKAANAWQRLTERIRADHPEFPALSLGKLRKTAANLIKSVSDGETVAVAQIDYSAVDSEAVERLVQDNTIVLTVTDDAMIAVAFAAVKLRGYCDRETKELALNALKRERLPRVIAGRGWDSPPERGKWLDLLVVALERVPESPPSA